jgi:GNAT superfamily N-acetyltransferase
MNIVLPDSTARAIAVVPATQFFLAPRNTSMSVPIRRSDIDEINRFFVSFWKPLDVSIALFDYERLKKCDEFYVAEITGEIAGAIALAYRGCDMPDERPDCADYDPHTMPTLATLFVLPRFHGQRIGRQLTEFGVRQFVQAGRTPIYCDVSTDKMKKLLDRLPDELRRHLRCCNTFQHGDDWEFLEGVRRRGHLPA